ncbi:PqqD family peptide modification chaperone [Zoogloea sp.]|uniref:PqqD family peptide modification chaperone n=1 Tax=Zoogloea sp. TaxID=49181 RepID=UPI0026045869|nr:PqqD family peptide modification chaperone [uncultured Zoogloea sp.]
MGGSVFSSQWYRVAGLHPSLRAQLRVTRQIHRREVWYVLADPLSGRFHRMNAAAYAFVGRCDGRHSVEALSEALLAEAPEHALTQDEIVRLLVQLNQRGLIQCELTPDVAAIFHREQEASRRQRRLGVNPLAFRLRLGDPSALLARFDPWLAGLVSGWMLLFLAMLIGGGALVAAMHFDQLQTEVRTWMATPRFLLIAWLIYPLIKTVHELAHGLAVRRYGGEVHQVGVSLLLLTPAPFVDASAASAFRHASQRLTVSAAGIVTELAIAGLALVVWALVEPGLVRDVSLVAAVIGGVSTVLFNGNPLLRFDAYYMLCDAFDLPNLATRSTAFWRYLLLGRLLGLADVPSPEPGRGERPWLLLYAPASWLYRVVLSVAIVGWIGSWSRVLGLLAGVAMLGTLLVMPVVIFWRRLLRLALPDAQRRRALRAAGALCAGLVVLLGVVPLPFSSLAQGVVWVPEQAQLRTGTDGFLMTIEARHGDRVEAGQVLARLEDPRLQAEVERYRHRLAALDADLFQAMLRDPVKLRNVEEEMERVRTQLARALELQAALELRAGVGGQLVMPNQADMQGVFVRRGTLLGHILTGEPGRLRVAIEQDVAALVREDTRSVSVRLAEQPGAAFPARLLRAVPAATERLPSAALGDFAGGSLPVDPADQDHLRTPAPVFVIDLNVDGLPPERAGGRGWARFDHGWQPLAVQWGRQLKQLFLRHFNPAA